MMLARAATRKLRRDAFRAPTTHFAEALALPRLCAVQLRHTSNAAPLTPATHDARRQQHQQPRRRPSLSTPAQAPARSSRSLATSAELHPSSHSHSHSHSQVDGFMQAWGPRVPSPELSRLKAWDTTSPLIVHDHFHHITPVSRGTGQGITGDPVEMHQNLYACLRVGRTDRAALILRRLSVLYAPSAPEMTDAHNIFLQTLLELALEEQGSGAEALQSIDEWFNTNMVAKAIVPNAHTFVTLLRAAVNFLSGDKQETAVLRYLDMANECGPTVLEQVNTSPDLTDDEWNTIIRLQPDEFDEPPAMDAIHDMQYNTPDAVQSAVQQGLPLQTAQIKPVDQKGFGLITLKQALAVFNDTETVQYPHDMEGTQAEKDRAHAYARQLQMEKDGLDAAIQRWKAEDQKLSDMGIHGVLKTKTLQALMFNWYSALVPIFKTHMEYAKDVLSNPTKENSKDDVHSYGAWLEMCTPERLAANSITRIIHSCVDTKGIDSDQLKIASLSIAIGNDIMDHINSDAQLRQEKFVKAQRKQARKVLIAKLSKNGNAAPRPVENQKSLRQPIEVPFVKTEIPLNARVKIGALCLESVLKAARITVTAEDPKTGKQLTSTQAAFHHQMRLHQGKRMGWIVPHHEILTKLRNEPVNNIVSVRLPMVVPPKAWSSFDDGGYYSLQSKVLRQKAGDVSQRAYTSTAIENGDMKQVLAGLDVLGKVPWQINKPVFDIMAEAWNSGEGLAGLVPEDTGLKRPADPPADASYPERARWAKQLKEFENTKSGFHSQRCFQNFQLEVASAMANEKELYFPHSVDFRGRAYPIPPILNHIGSDVARGLLKFANGKELGAIGLQWLKVHLANLAGFDKASLREREQFAMDNMNEIIDSATNPLGGRRWWAKAEDPWQCLACCMELKNAFDLPDPTRYVSQLPVHQDGTCNGLQHYAALGGDEAGARQVNLEPSDRPQDIYTGVAELVKEMVDEDVAKGNPQAKYIQGHISRKVVKRTVMTNVYGVTFMGAKAQVHDELKHIFPNFVESSEVRSLQSVAMYVAFKIFEALGKIFNGAQEIQYWLGECGDRITTSLNAEQIRALQARYEGKKLAPDARFKADKQTKSGMKRLAQVAESFKTGIIWTTPLRMPIVQPYTKDSAQKVVTPLQTIVVQKRNSGDAVDKRKQLQAFPPNFIHSLDASHMLLSALKCNELGLDFAAVHDSFWTHACDIPNLNTILRDAFVRMHSEDITSRLAAEFGARYADNMYRANLHANTEPAKRITKWRYRNKSAKTETSDGIGRKHGWASLDEVALEARRQELLNSEDPALRAEGEAMETPTSIWLEYKDPKTIASSRLALLGDTETKATKKDDEPSKVDEIMENSKALEGEAMQADEPDLKDADSEKTPASKRWVGQMSTIEVWLPLTFPQVPKKGGWDVARLRESKYFFS